MVQLPLTAAETRLLEVGIDAVTRALPGGEPLSEGDKIQDLFGSIRKHAQWIDERWFTKTAGDVLDSMKIIRLCVMGRTATADRASKITVLAADIKNRNAIKHLDIASVADSIIEKAGEIIAEAKGANA